MPIKITYQPDVALAGQLAAQAGFGRLMTERQKAATQAGQYAATLAEKQRQFDIGHQLNHERLWAQEMANRRRGNIDAARALMQKRQQEQRLAVEMHNAQQSRDQRQQLQDQREAAAIEASRLGNERDIEAADLLSQSNLEKEGRVREAKIAGAEGDAFEEQASQAESDIDDSMKAIMEEARNRGAELSPQGQKLMADIEARLRDINEDGAGLRSKHRWKALEDVKGMVIKATSKGYDKLIGQPPQTPEEIRQQTIVWQPSTQDPNDPNATMIPGQMIRDKDGNSKFEAISGWKPPEKEATQQEADSARMKFQAERVKYEEQVRQQILNEKLNDVEYLKKKAKADSKDSMEVIPEPSVSREEILQRMGELDKQYELANPPKKEEAPQVESIEAARMDEGLTGYFVLPDGQMGYKVDAEHIAMQDKAE